MPTKNTQAKKQTMQAEFKLVMWLLCLFFGLSILLAIMAYTFHDNLPQQVWSRIVGLLVASPIYLVMGYLIHKGKRLAFNRLRISAIVGVAIIGWIVIEPGLYPMWMRVEQAIQGLVLIGVIVAVHHPTIRAHVAKKPKQST
jgi:cation transport ATPase